MIFPRNAKIIFRIVSAFMAGIFLFQQVAWADGGELIASQTVVSQPTGVSSDKLQSSQVAAQSTVDGGQLPPQ